MRAEGTSYYQTQPTTPANEKPQSLLALFRSAEGFGEESRPTLLKGLNMFRASLAVFAALYFAIPADAGILVHRHAQGCNGGQASAGCQGKQGGCTSVQAGFQGYQAGCHGNFGGFHPLHRLFHRRHGQASAPVAVPVNPPQPMPKKADTLKTSMVFGEVFSTQLDALDAANAQRAKRGLLPFRRDEGLMAGALACAQYRANNRIHGHSRNDFAYLPAGATAKVAGCSALEESWGFQACDLYADWKFAGAASVKGSDNLVYHQLFVK